MAVLSIIIRRDKCFIYVFFYVLYCAYVVQIFLNHIGT